MIRVNLLYLVIILQIIFRPDWLAFYFRSGGTIREGLEPCSLRTNSRSLTPLSSLWRTHGDVLTRSRALC